jgi:hypothetical protein
LSGYGKSLWLGGDIRTIRYVNDLRDGQLAWFSWREQPSELRERRNAMAVAEGFEPYSAALEGSQNGFSPGKTHLDYSLQISLAVLKLCSECAHD